MSSKTIRKPPAYRQRKGYDQAIVTLTDAGTGKRRDYWLGEHGSPESREVYYRLLAEYEALGRRLPEKKLAGIAAAEPSGCIDVDELALEYWRRVAREHLPKRSNAIRVSLRILRQMDGSTPVDQYGPRRLRLLREAMVAGDPASDPPRRPWSRTTVNDRVRIIVSIFRWGVTQEIVPVSVAEALAMVDPLKRGRTKAHEGKKVGPVPEFMLEATLAELPSPVAAIVRLQLLTGVRPGEIVRLRGGDLERDERSGLLVAQLAEHKTAHLGGERVLYFGPEAEAILDPFMNGRNPSRALFSPAEAEAERRARQHALRKTPIGYGNRPGRTGPMIRRVRRASRTPCAVTAERFSTPASVRSRRPNTCGRVCSRTASARRAGPSMPD